jgi:hypothetical protein
MSMLYTDEVYVYVVSLAESGPSQPDDCPTTGVKSVR